VARVTGGPVREVRGFVTGFGAGLLRRQPDRSLFFDRPGEPSQLVSASRCNARVLHSDPTRELLVVGCGGGEETLRRASLVGVHTQIDLDVEVESFEVDRSAPVADRLVPLYPGIEALVVDLETRETHALERRDRVIASRGTTLLVERRGRLLLGDVREQLLPIGRPAPVSPILRKPPVVFLRPWLVDLEQGLVRGRLERDALALTRDGALLVPRRDGDARRLPEGPLSWLRPQPLD
jgi:hypothetical protein